MSKRAPESGSGPLAPGYTVALLVVALLSAIVAWVEVGLIEQLEAEGETVWALVLRIDQIWATVLAPLGLGASLARWRRWPSALRLTQFVSYALIIVVPVGTALFVVWWVWVRPKEGRSSESAPEPRGIGPATAQ
ncbi:MAG: hypothetical protein MPN21_27575 [Thermoanaerobaculia bacterium]|nr:hypothetical protein [Thermoanaerobaculia bacterium]